MQLLSSAITHCRFEASDSAADEIVLLRILKLMESMILGPVGDTLGDESICEMMETGLSMCCQGRLSELLRSSAEMSMTSMCQVIFERLKRVEPEKTPPEDMLEDRTDPGLAPLRVDPAARTNGANGSEETFAEGRNSSGTNRADDPLEPTDAINANVASTGNEGTLLETSSDIATKSYSLPSIRELLRVLINLLDPHDRQHTDSMRVMALRILDVALEVAGSSIIRHESLSRLVKDELCRHLFQLVRSDNMLLLQSSLRAAGTLLATCREVLKLQQELFLSYLVACLHLRMDIPQEPGMDPALYDGVLHGPKLAKYSKTASDSGRSTPVPGKDRLKLGIEGGARKPDAREAMVESIGALSRIPTFMVELYINYDCEIDSDDLCEEMVGLLSRNAFPDSATWSTTNVPPLCLEALLGYVQLIAARLDRQAESEGLPDPVALREQRRLKKIIVQGTARLNENPKDGIAYLTSEGVIEDPEDPQCLSRFLKGTTRISKRVLGDFLTKKFNEPILAAFLDQFDFQGKRVDEALRVLLETFRLPGEAALIERLVLSFSEKYCASSTPEGVADKDAVYVLTYAIIMLNTDQHNPNLKSQNRMSLIDFSRNLRGVNGGEDFNPQYLQDIYNSIKTREIILPDEHDNTQAFDYAWKALLHKADFGGSLITCDSNMYDADMFAATWKPVIATLSYVFMSASDDAVFSRIVASFDQCARIAAKYKLIEVLDRIIFILSTMSTLALETPPNTALNTEVQVGGNTVMVSEMAVKFGRDFKAQLATVVLFRVVVDNEASITNGWTQLVRTWLNLFVNSLLPPSSMPSQTILGISPVPLSSPSQVIDRAQKPNESGILSVFTSYLTSYAADDPPEPSDEELPEKNSPVVITVKPDVLSAGPTNGQRQMKKGVVYDPAVVFILELTTILALRDLDTIQSVGPAAADALLSVIRDAVNIHPTAVSRALFYLLCLLEASHDLSFLRVPVILHAISSLDPSMQEKSASLILKGIVRCIKKPGPLRNEMVNSPDFWAILQGIHSLSDIAPAVFNVMEHLTARNSLAITADNYEAAVALLNDFASAGGTGAILEQRQDGPGKRGKTVKQQKPLFVIHSRFLAKTLTLQPRDNDVVKRGVEAVGLIHQLSSRVPALLEQSHLDREQAWVAYWSPIFRALVAQSTNPCREIRNQALAHLQRSLLSTEHASTGHHGLIVIFDEVLFPLVLRLLKPEVYRSDPVGMNETRVHAATLLCKAFLHYLVRLSEWDGMLDLWLRILDILDRLMNSGQGESLEEAVPEILKNIILVMSSSGYLAPPNQKPELEKLWIETWRRVDRLLPGLFAEIFPDDKKAASSSTPVPDSHQQEQPLPQPQQPEQADLIPTSAGPA
ncbi:MAG: GDP/GTP exchange factor for ARF [Phylliscum demangeonii]|nr:MAG: GDP/GTP exchange factor for ARF [Phylliscum demangeonii]